MRLVARIIILIAISGISYGLAPYSLTPKSELSEHAILEHYEVPQLEAMASSYFENLTDERLSLFFQKMQPALGLYPVFDGDSLPEFKTKNDEIAFIKANAQKFSALLGNENFITLEGISKYGSIQCSGCTMLNSKYFEKAGYETYWFHVTENKDFISESHASLIIKLKTGGYFLVDTAMNTYEEISLTEGVAQRIDSATAMAIILNEVQSASKNNDYRIADPDEKSLSFSEIKEVVKSKRMPVVHKRGYILKPVKGMTFALLSELASKLYAQLLSPLYEDSPRKQGIDLNLVLRLYQRAHEIFPEDPYLISGMTFLNFQLNYRTIHNWNTVTDILKEQMQKYPGNTKLRMNAVTYYILTKNNQYARQLIEEVLQYDSGDFEALLNYTLILPHLLRINKVVGVDSQVNVEILEAYFGFLSEGLKKLKKNRDKEKEVKVIIEGLDKVIHEIASYYPSEGEKLKAMKIRYVRPQPFRFLRRWVLFSS